MLNGKFIKSAVVGLLVLTFVFQFIIEMRSVIPIKKIHGIEMTEALKPNNEAKIVLGDNWITKKNYTQDDPSLVKVVRRDFLRPPISRSIPYDFTKYSRAPMCNNTYSQSEMKSVDYNPSCGQIQAIGSILRRMTPGFFLDCGANDGVYVSNTLWLERKLGWSGLLVEADPNAYGKMVQVKRKGWMSPTCFSLTKTPKRMDYYLSNTPSRSAISGLIKSKNYEATKAVIVQCLPVYTLLLALDRTVIDFFSLDVEGNEMEILETIPFDKVTFKVLAIEHLLFKDGRKVLREFMESKGYRFYQTVVKDASGDSIFLHPSVVLNDEEIKRIGHEDEEKVVKTRE